MVLDRLENAMAYQGAHPRLQKAFDFLQTADLARMPLGRHDIVGDEVYALVQEYNTKPDSEGAWEAHRKYIDVQYIIDGTERMGYANLQGLAVRKPYDDQEDYWLFDGSGDFFTVRSGMFTIFTPQDAHMPCLAAGAPSPVRKVVVKVAV